MNDSNKLEPGDLAMIIKSAMGLSIGKVVECVRQEGIHPDYGMIWLVKSNKDDLVTEYGAKGDNFHVPHDWLRKIPKGPIPGDEDTLDAPRKEVETIDGIFEVLT